jgi:hypothetical protein
VPKDRTFYGSQGPFCVGQIQRRIVFAEYVCYGLPQPIHVSPPDQVPEVDERIDRGSNFPNATFSVDGRILKSFGRVQ